MYSGMFCIILDLYPIDASTSPPAARQPNVSRDIAKYLLGDKMVPVRSSVQKKRVVCDPMSNSLPFVCHQSSFSAY